MRFSGGIAACLAFSFAASLTIAARAADDDFKPLFNGKNLEGWEFVGAGKDTWKTEDGILYCTGGGGWLSTDKEYANFILELEFRVPEGGNSGVFLRSPRQGDPAYTGMEVQVLDDDGKDYKNLEPWQYCGSIYKVAAPKVKATKKAGEWQKYRIECNGPKVKIALNDKEIVETDLTMHKDKEAAHPGIKRTTGYIGLQNHGSRLDYRNIKIKVLP